MFGPDRILTFVFSLDKFVDMRSNGSTHTGVNEIKALARKYYTSHHFYTVPGTQPSLLMMIAIQQRNSVLG